MSQIETFSIKINHSMPLELKSFTSSMLCIENQYKRYLASKGIKNKEYNLCINKIRHGSINVDFVKGKAYKLIGHGHYILEGFIKIFEQKIEEIIEQKIKKETGYSLIELKEIIAIFDAISKDDKSEMHMAVHIGDRTTNLYSIDSQKANAVKDGCLRLIDDMNEPVVELKKNVTLHWKQVGEDDKSSSIDKGVIEEIDAKAKVKIICDESLKQEMIFENQRNPFNMFYIVDAEIKRISGKSVPIAYIIKKIHDKGLIDDD